MTIEIVSIVDRPDLIAYAAHAQWLQWARKNGRTVAQQEAWMATHTATVGPNQAWVLLDGGEPAAIATFEVHDLDERPDLSPWLANLVVAEAFRGRGHAIRLVGQCEAAAKAAGIPRLYLNTEGAAPLYARLGWFEIGVAEHKGHPVIVMAKDLG